jgi:hypothetical protein
MSRALQPAQNRILLSFQVFIDMTVQAQLIPFAFQVGIEFPCAARIVSCQLADGATRRRNGALRAALAANAELALLAAVLKFVGDDAGGQRLTSNGGRLGGQLLQCARTTTTSVFAAAIRIRIGIGIRRSGGGSSRSDSGTSNGLTIGNRRHHRRSSCAAQFALLLTTFATTAGSCRGGGIGSRGRTQLLLQLLILQLQCHELL